MVVMFFGGSPALAACEGRVVTAHVSNGPLCLPLEPRRIVVLDPTFSLGMALDLDLPVVAAPLFNMSNAALRDSAVARGVLDLGSLTAPSLERIIGAKPDLIIGSDFMAGGYYEMLSRIAPTALIDVADWKRYFAVVAEVSGETERMAGMFDAYDRRVAALKPKIPSLEVSVVRITSWDFQVYLDGPQSYAPFTILRELGVARTPYETSTDETAMKRPGWEELDNLDGDVLLYIVGGTNDSDSDGRHEEVLANPLWKMLPAVAAGRVHRVESATWMEFSGLASAHAVLDDVERYVIAAP